MSGIVKLGEIIDNTELTVSFFTLPQCLLHPLALGDVDGVSEVQYHFPGFISHRIRFCDEIQGSVRQRHDNFHRLAFARLENLDACCLTVVCMLLRIYIPECFSQKIVGRLAECRGEYLVHEFVFPVFIDAKHDVARMFYEGAILEFAVFIGFFNSFALGDVLHECQDVHHSHHRIQQPRSRYSKHVCSRRRG